jgi:hypothetical protein
MPREAPVISATLPARRPGISRRYKPGAAGWPSTRRC